MLQSVHHQPGIQVPEAFSVSDDSVDEFMDLAVQLFGASYEETGIEAENLYEYCDETEGWAFWEVLTHVRDPDDHGLSEGMDSVPGVFVWYDEVDQLLYVSQSPPPEGVTAQAFPR